MELEFLMATVLDDEMGLLKVKKMEVVKASHLVKLLETESVKGLEDVSAPHLVLPTEMLLVKTKVLALASHLETSLVLVKE
jgi:hypothetical protein